MIPEMDCTFFHSDRSYRIELVGTDHTDCDPRVAISVKDNGYGTPSGMLEGFSFAR